MADSVALISSSSVVKTSFNFCNGTCCSFSMIGIVSIDEDPEAARDPWSFNVEAEIVIGSGDCNDCKDLIKL